MNLHQMSLYQEACKYIPGGVNSPVRAFRSVGGEPIFFKKAAGARTFAADGRQFIDYVGSWGPMILGHAHPQVIAAVQAVAADGLSFGAPTELETRLARRVVDLMPAIELVRFVSSGTEATMSAIRLGRAVTGRELVLKFAGAYHGHVDGLLAQAGSGLATQGIPASPGVSAAAAADTAVVAWNDPDALVEAVRRQAPAAIVAEPLPANMGLVPPRPGFLELLREQADASGALLVLDEVISGFRVARGGAQELTEVHGDLVVLGKIIGGGLPAAAVGGRAELLELLAPAGAVYQAGTLSGNPLAVAAGLATLALLDEAAYVRLAAITEQLAAGLRAAAGEWAGGHAVQVVSMPGLFTVFFGEHPMQNLADVEACDLRAHAAWCRGLLSRGVYPPPSQFEAWFPSLAHGPEHIERTLAAAEAAFRELP
jgi:glutamate-1-semialdehyde 2,1-aminomutase